jgi:hypothetical protein
MADEHTPLISSSKPDLPRSDDYETNLTKFRKAIGINTYATGDEDLESARKGAKGLYKEIINLQKWRSRQYQLVEILFYIALGGQILIGATLASLGPLSKLNPTSITILGIANTVMAGILAVFKGQNLPDRLRKDEYQMKKVQDFIEETEIRLAIGSDGDFTAEELDGIVQQVFEKYNTAKDTAEMNRSSSYAHQAEGTVKVKSGGRNSVVSRIANEEENGKGKGKGKYVID